MLLDRAAELATKINNYQKLKNTSEEADKFATRADQFGSLSLLMTELRNTLSIWAQAGVRVDFEPSDGLAYAEKARLLRAAIKADPAKVNDPPFDIKYAFIDRLNGIATAGDKAVRAAWKAYVDSRAAFGADDVLSVLARVPQLRTSVASVQRIRGDVAAFGASLPLDPKEAIEKIETLVSQHESAWRSLEASDIPPSVVDFIRAAAATDALLSAYTSEVQTWLESRDLLSAFRIKLR